MVLVTYLGLSQINRLAKLARAQLLDLLQILQGIEMGAFLTFPSSMLACRLCLPRSISAHGHRPDPPQIRA